jgi:hypothetical protein
MSLPPNSVGRSAIAGLAALSFMQIICTERAHADVTVLNPNFQLPAVGQAAGGAIQCPQSSPTIGWVFSCGAGGSSGVQLNSVFTAPNAPPPGQVGFIQNSGAIAQAIDFK